MLCFVTSLFLFLIRIIQHSITRLHQPYNSYTHTHASWILILHHYHLFLHKPCTSDFLYMNAHFALFHRSWLRYGGSILAVLGACGCVYLANSRFARQVWPVYLLWIKCTQITDCLCRLGSILINKYFTCVKKVDI